MVRESGGGGWWWLCQLMLEPPLWLRRRGFIRSGDMVENELERVEVSQMTVAE